MRAVVASLSLATLLVCEASATSSESMLPAAEHAIQYVSRALKDAGDGSSLSEDDGPEVRRNERILPFSNFGVQPQVVSQLSEAVLSLSDAIQENQDRSICEDQWALVNRIGHWLAAWDRQWSRGQALARPTRHAMQFPFAWQHQCRPGSFASYRAHIAREAIALLASIEPLLLAVTDQQSCVWELEDLTMDNSDNSYWKAINRSCVLLLYTSVHHLLLLKTAGRYEEAQARFKALLRYPMFYDGLQWRENGGIHVQAPSRVLSCCFVSHCI